MKDTERPKTPRQPFLEKMNVDDDRDLLVEQENHFEITI